MSSESLDFDRTAYLINPGDLAKVRVTVVGLGSGGTPVCDHLTMAGVRRWDLYDPEVLDATNLVKHPRMRRDVGRPKVAVQEEWILDRNPTAEVDAFCENVMESPSFQKSVERSSLVLACPDTKGVRDYVNDRCVAAGVPMVVASVFRTGIGGEVFGYLPGVTGCYRCLELHALRQNLNLTDEQLGLTEDEERRIYGLGEREFRASGLSMDIQMISLIQARVALSFLLRDKEHRLPAFKANWIVFGNRPAPGIFSRHFESRLMLLRPQESCNCHSDSERSP